MPTLKEIMAVNLILKPLEELGTLNPLGSRFVSRVTTCGHTRLYPNGNPPNWIDLDISKDYTLTDQSDPYKDSHNDNDNDTPNDNKKYTTSASRPP